jgi:selenocysteine lyase/cysteine desulfurase
VITHNCTHGLNIALRTLVKPGGKVVISGFEHNAVTRPLHALGANITVAGRCLFDPGDTLESFEKALKNGADAVVFTHVSNVFGYILPVEEICALCKRYGVPFIIDAAQSAGSREVKLDRLGADFIAMPGHKGLLGPQGTGILLCGRNIDPLLYGGTGNQSIVQQMPEDLPERGEAGTINVPGIAGLHAGLEYLLKEGVETIGKREAMQARQCAKGLERLGFHVFYGENQCGTVSFLPQGDCEEAANKLAEMGVAVRAGLHCAPLAHESAGTLDSGTVRVSFGWDAAPWQTEKFLLLAKKLQSKL